MPATASIVRATGTYRRLQQESRAEGLMRIKPTAARRAAQGSHLSRVA